MLSRKESKEYSKIGSLLHLLNKKKQMQILIIEKNIE
jgi:phage gp46-like protein